MYVYFHAELSFCTLLCTQNLLSLIICLLFSSATPELTPDTGQWVFGEWGFQIPRFEDSKRLSSTKLPAVWFPAHSDASQAIPHTLLAWRTDSQGGAGALLTWHMQGAWHRKQRSQLQQHCRCDTPPAAALLPRGYRAKLLLIQKLQDQTQVQSSTIQQQTNCALSRSPVGFTCVCVWRRLWSHVHMYTRWVF